MNQILLALEVVGWLTAAVFGILWARNPNGPYEPITFLALLLGSSAVDLIRRHQHSAASLPIDDRVTALTSQVAQLVESLQRERATSSAPSENIKTIRVAAAHSPPKPVDADDISKRVIPLLEARRSLMEKLTKLAKARNLDIVGLPPSEIGSRLHLPEPFRNAVVTILTYTASLQHMQLAELEQSGWVTDMAEATTNYLNLVIHINEAPATLTGTK